MIIIILLCIILFIINVFLCYKFFIIKKAVKSYEDIGTGKYGYYKTPKVIVYIKELDRYLNGYSKITIDKIEATTKYDKQTYIAEEKNLFLSLKLTSEIEWLESTDHLKKTRKEKLKQLNSII